MVLPHHWEYGMTPSTITTFEDFREAVAGYRLPRVLLAALELDLFTAMGQRSWTIPGLANELRVSERGLSILCRNLAMVGLLKKNGAGYKTNRLASTALNAMHPSYRGGYLDLIQSHWVDWLRLLESVRSGLPLDQDMTDRPESRRQFTWAMHHRTVEIAPAVAAQLDFRRANTLLDLGGGPGTYALAFLAKHPRLRATVCDRDAALEVAKEVAATHRAGRRLSYLPLDFTKDSIPGVYDVIWYSNVLHIYSPAMNQAIFRRALAALSPGGRLIIQDAFLHGRAGLYPADATLFAFSMLLFTEEGDTYSAAETTKWLTDAGFARIRLRTMKKGREDWEGGILEAVAPERPLKTTGRQTRLRARSDPR